MGAGSSRKSCCNQKSFTNSRQQRSGGDSGNISKAEMARLSDGYRLVREEASGMILRFFVSRVEKEAARFLNQKTWVGCVGIPRKVFFSRSEEQIWLEGYTEDPQDMAFKAGSL